MSFYVYGKRTDIWIGKKTHEIHQPDKSFLPLDSGGHRVSRVNKALAFDSKDAAQAFIDKNRFKKSVVLEIREK